jgi:hypothetical protein
MVSDPKMGPKWLYIFTHFVQKGSVKQTDLVTHTLSTGRTRCAGAGSENGVNGRGFLVVFATSVSKYVFKKGRLTVAPERLLRASGLLGENEKMCLLAKHQGPRARSFGATMNQKNENGPNLEIGQVIEKERLRGMKYANAWAELDSLHGELLGEAIVYLSLATLETLLVTVSLTARLPLPY